MIKSRRSDDLGQARRIYCLQPLSVEEALFPHVGYRLLHVLPGRILGQYGPD